MKKLAFLSICLATICLHLFATSATFPIHSPSCQEDCQDLCVVTMCDLTDRELNEIMQGDRPNVAVEFSEQATLPINFFLKGDLFNLVNEGECGVIEIKQTFYVRCMGQEMLFSTNLKEWKSFSAFITGTVSLELRIQDGIPSISFGAEMNQRSCCQES